MKLFGSILGGTNKPENSSLSWQHLTDQLMLEELKEVSFEQPVMVYKHSTRCGISSMMLSRLERNYDLEQDALRCYFLDLIKYRNLSEQLAEAFGVRHESPQVMLIRNGKAVYHASHGDIDLTTIKEFLGL
ncbi:bacillithiol system redox-active protein YtxJ [Robertkochia marina]|uniref:Bacillithiol system redox-active protein YtxJ n=1 Tax=Robertkochia marina TaxID=1227945 RepID=A0A4S3M2Z1_9FLAO|nr:bacillithiol system redox-active protein YtxJ [Robertkochia marina]THD67989.1 bacillithiol system redox-active protein YtxJ [Robertkochia marina]TRZ41515.1 bacillithiol system redox-active protein YtxJ [Robertkochia marina]